tara:strand:+ start:62128 stop:62427 length:300 start_codon:yes stop_codon:yes gene_type:complete
MLLHLMILTTIWIVIGVFFGADNETCNWPTLGRREPVVTHGVALSHSSVLFFNKHCFFGAGNEIRTRDPDLGKVVLYQLSYSRIQKKALRFEVVRIVQK